MIDIWPMIAAERRALADDLATIGGEQWQTPSWCAGWSVQDVLAHMTSTARMTPPAFFRGLAAARFNFPRFVQAGVARNRGRDGAETLARFRSSIDLRTAPPGPLASWLGEAIVHAEDIRRPLGIEHEYPSEPLKIVALFYTQSNLLIGAKKRIEGLQLRATDTDLTYGSGELAEGRLIDLVMAMTGRAGACERLTGAGVATLRGRCS